MGQPPHTPHFLHGLEAGGAGVLALAQRALQLRAGAPPQRFDGATLGAVFFNPSLRTRMSLESAAWALGIRPLVVEPGKGSWGWELKDGTVMDGAAQEHIREAVPVIASYVDLLAVRCFAGLVDAEEDRADPVLAAFAALSPRPVINMESARFHPLQGLADAATWLAHLGPDLAGKRVTLTWAPHPRALPAAVPNQVLLTAASLGMEVTVAHPEGFDLDPQVVTWARDLGGSRVRVVHDQDEALAGAQVVVAKSWSGWQGYGRREAEAEHRATLGAWRVDEARLGRAGFMHCLPVRRNVVVTDGVLDGDQSWALEEAALRKWTAMALLEQLCGGPPWTP